MLQPRHILLVTGARALDPSYPQNPGTHGSQLWAERELARIVHAAPGGALVVHGGCPYGPDRWATDAARLYGKTVVEFRLDGVKWINGRAGLPWASYTPRQGTSRRRWPLTRNEAMVGACFNAQCVGWVVSVAAFTAPWTLSRGTIHTMDLARQEFGLDVAELICPMDASPYR